MNSKNSYFNKEQTKWIKDMLYDNDYIEYENNRQKQIKRKEWLYEHSGVIYLHIIFWTCITWAFLTY